MVSSWARLKQVEMWHFKMCPIADMTKMILEQIIGPIQQWLLERGKCVTCGESLSSFPQRTLVGSEAKVVDCPCGQTYLYLPQANLYKRLTANKYA